MKKAESKEALKQTNIGNFFKKEKEPENLWNTVHVDVQEGSYCSERNKVGKSLYRNALSKTTQARRENCNLIPESPVDGLKRKTLLARKPKKRNSLAKSSCSHADSELKRAENAKKCMTDVPVLITSPKTSHEVQSFTNIKSFDKGKNEVEGRPHDSPLTNDTSSSFGRLNHSKSFFASAGPSGIPSGVPLSSIRCHELKYNGVKISQRKASVGLLGETSSKDTGSNKIDSFYIPQQNIIKQSEQSVSKESKKRSFRLGKSGFSPLKKKFAYRNVDSEKEQSSNTRRVSSFEEMSGHSDVVKEAETKENTRRQETLSREMEHTMFDEKPADILKRSKFIPSAEQESPTRDTSQAAFNTSKLNSSFKLSKKISKKLIFATKQSENQKAKRNDLGPKKVNDARYNLDEDEVEEDFVSSYKCEKTSSKNGFRKSVDPACLRNSTKDMEDLGRLKNESEASNISKKEKASELDERQTSNFDSLDGIQTCEYKNKEDQVKTDFDTSKDSFTELLEEIDISLEKQGSIEKNEGREAHAAEEEFWSDSLLNESAFDENNGLYKEAEDPNYKVMVKTVLVLEVLRQEGQTIDNLHKPEKVLRLFDEESSQESFCVLREDWELMEIFPGDSVHITDCIFKAGSTIVLDNNSQRYLVLSPNTLVSGTTISMGITCQRRAVLSELFKTDGPNEAMFLGTFLHEVFDFLISQRNVSKNELQQKSLQFISQFNHLNTLYSLDIDQQMFMGKVRELVSGMSLWAQKFLKAKPSLSDDVIDFKRGKEVSPGSNSRLAISDVVDIEESILCPSLGLKGKVDASVTVKIHRERKGNFPRSSDELETYLLPFELKTGKMFSKLGSIEHRAQVILYTMMMSEKHGYEIDAGLLYYMKTGHLQGVPATPKEKRSLIIKRNELARYLSKENRRSNLSMPGLLKDERTCQRCPLVSTCMIFHKSVEQGSQETSGIGKLFKELTGHLTENEMRYFVKWYRLIMLETQEESLANGQRKMWTKTSEERESNGKCYGKMSIKEVLRQDENDWKYIFFKRGKQDAQVPLSNMSLANGERVLISEEFCKTYGLCAGFIQSISADEIHIFCPERIRPRNDLYKTLFRIEKDESMASQKIPLGNLMKLLLSCNAADTKLRKLIIELAPPKFCLAQYNNFVGLSRTRPSSSQNLVTFQKNNGQKYFIKDSQMTEISSVYNSLNPDQKEAVARCMCAEDYVMILGMPGTGKTTTIACIVKMLVSLGKSVLIASYTHTAVDNILLKLKQMNLDFIRLGRRRRVHEEIRPYIVDEAAKNVKNVEDLHLFYNHKNVVATTCLGINHPLFLKKRFDYCIVDEASQITQPVCFGVIRYADAFVLVGDHYQLPPLVQSIEARHSGMDISLFKLLSEKHPSAIVSLRFQYRMHRDIMSLTNNLIYGHRMQCGNESTALHQLKLPTFNSFKDRISSARGLFLQRVLNPRQPVVFINTDSVPFPESIVGNHIHNEKEAYLLSLILKGLIECGVEASDIGIISPFRNQLKTINHSLNNLMRSNVISGVEINTVDKYQGRDKSCIVVSFVRSNNKRNVGELLKDWRRLNVAITRAKHKLIMIGSKETLSCSPVLAKLLEFVETKGWMELAPMEPF